MPLDSRIVHPFDKPHERLMWDELKSSLSSAFAADPRKSILLGNFICGRQVDACLIWSHGLAVIELKNYQGQLHAPLNERWFIGDKPVHAGGALNPLEQVRGARHALGDRLRKPWSVKFPGAPVPNWKYAAGRSVFLAGTSWQDLLDDQTRRWFAISGIDTIAADLFGRQIGTYDLNADQIKFIAETVLSTPPRRIVHREQQQILDNGLEGITLGGLTLGGVISETHEERPAMDRAIEGPIPAVIREYPLADDEGFLLHLADIRLQNGERQITVSQNYTGSQKWDRLKHGLRLGAYLQGEGRWAARLGLVRPVEGGKWSNREHRSDIDEIDEITGLDVKDTLLGLGAANVGTKEEVYGEQNRKKNELCVLFPEDKPEAGLAAYVLTTVLPLMEDARA
jgi:hypothetical protein